MILENGQRYDGDLLVGADGIWSKVNNLILHISKQLSLLDSHDHFRWMFSDRLVRR